MEFALWLVAAYLIGSIPFGVVVARVMGGSDPRSEGSGNIGATNVARTLGKKAGLITLGCDAAKGYLPALAAVSYLDTPWGPPMVGLAAFLGHLFPLYLKFKGGKGIATGAGVFLAVSPLVLFFAMVVFVATVWWSRFVGLGSVAAVIVLPVASILTGQPGPFIALALAICLLSVWKHRLNLRKILKGTESKLGESLPGVSETRGADGNDA
jgi:glycerol-3-phosphate acyltransferase PlsY